MTNRLYFNDAYLRTFDATVDACEIRDNAPWLRLDQTAFYPTGGGQPYDTGVLQSGDTCLHVNDVLVDDHGDIWHLVEAPLPLGAQVHGQIDWERRFDHMQQHGGEHILAGCLFHLFGGVTHGLHLGEQLSTIDVSLPDGRMRLTADEVRQAETLANDRLQSDAPIRCWFPSAEELATLPLRKPSAVNESVRVVAAGDFEMVPCGGTHPASCGQIGLIKILSVTPSRGKMRVCFVAGQRAVRHFQTLAEAVSSAGCLLSATADTLEESVRRLLHEKNQLSAQLDALQKQTVLKSARSLLPAARSLPNGHRLISGMVETNDAELLFFAASKLSEEEQAILLLGGQSEDQVFLAFVQPNNSPFDLSKILRQAGGKGGGKAGFARGSAVSEGVLEAAVAQILSPPSKTKEVTP